MDRNSAMRTDQILEGLEKMIECETDLRSYSGEIGDLYRQVGRSLEWHVHHGALSMEEQDCIQNSLLRLFRAGIEYEESSFPMYYRLMAVSEIIDEQRQG